METFFAYKQVFEIQSSNESKNITPKCVAKHNEGHSNADKLTNTNALHDSSQLIDVASISKYLKIIIWSNRNQNHMMIMVQ